MIATEAGPEPEPARKGVVTVLGIFAMDAVCRAPRLPYPGETLIAEGFALHPGGKGSNQAVGAARLGAEARLITRIGRDAGADLARATWAADGVRAFAGVSDARPTGAAVVFVQTGSGENAIAVHPGAALELSAADVDAAAEAGPSRGRARSSPSSNNRWRRRGVGWNGRGRRARWPSSTPRRRRLRPCPTTCSRSATGSPRTRPRRRRWPACPPPTVPNRRRRRRAR